MSTFLVSPIRALLAIGCMATALGASGCSSDELGTPPPQQVRTDMDSTLRMLAAKARGEDVSHVLMVDPTNAAGEVKVIAHGTDVGAIAHAIEDANGQPAFVGDEHVMGWLPVTQLEDLADRPEVRHLRVPTRPGAHDGETDPDPNAPNPLDVMGVPPWHAAGLLGAGVTVGILDIGFEGYEAALGGTLPNAVPYWDVDAAACLPPAVCPNPLGGPHSAHGLHMAEVVHQIAPDAGLVFARVDDTQQVTFAVDWLLSQGVDIISSSIDFADAGPGDGTGELEPVAQNVANAGVPWFASAGNDRFTHAAGNDLYLFAGFNFVFSPDTPKVLEPWAETGWEAGEHITVTVKWSDWTNVDINLDLYAIFDCADGVTTVALSEDPQSGAPDHRPFEAGAFDVPDWAVGCVIGVVAMRPFVEDENGIHLVPPITLGSVAINYYANHCIVDRVEMLEGGGELDILDWMPEHSLSKSPADIPSVFTVGAVVAESATFVPHPSSSEGPTLAPGGHFGSGHNKPDLAGYWQHGGLSADGGFVMGTSPATAQAAGAAALMLGAEPGIGLGGVQGRLIVYAVDVHDPGYDLRTGHGRLVMPPVPDLPEPEPPALQLRGASSQTPFEDGDVLTMLGTYEFELVLAAGVQPTGIVVGATGDSEVTPLADGLAVRWTSPGLETVTLSLTIDGTPHMLALTVDVQELMASAAPIDCGNGVAGTLLDILGTTPHSTYHAQASTDLVTWTVVDADIAVANGTAIWDSCALGAGPGTQLYRVIMP
jgi:Subtilase family